MIEELGSCISKQFPDEGVYRISRVEEWLATRKPMDYLQFQRIGYYNVDPDSTPEHLVFNRTVGLTDAWKKINK